MVWGPEKGRNIGQGGRCGKGGCMDWEGCDLVEVVPGKVAGKPVIRGTRILADTIVEDAALGAPVAEIHESFPSLPEGTIRKLLAFAHSKQLVP
jgi:uncharacterized protein (DUF433 family)